MKQIHLIRCISGFEAEFLYRSVVDYIVIGTSESYIELSEKLLCCTQQAHKINIHSDYGAKSLSIVKCNKKTPKLSIYERPVILDNVKYMEPIIFANRGGIEIISSALFRAAQLRNSNDDHVHIDDIGDNAVFPSCVSMTIYEPTQDDSTDNHKIKTLCNNLNSEIFPSRLNYMNLIQEKNDEFSMNIDEFMIVANRLENFVK